MRNGRDLEHGNRGHKDRKSAANGVTDPSILHGASRSQKRGNDAPRVRGSADKAERSDKTTSKGSFLDRLFRSRDSVSDALKKGQQALDDFDAAMEELVAELEDQEHIHHVPRRPAKRR